MKYTKGVSKALVGYMTIVFVALVALAASLWGAAFYMGSGPLFHVTVTLLFLLAFGAICWNILFFQKRIRSLYEARLEASAKLNDRIELAVNGINDGIWDWDVASNELYFSPRWKSMLGYEDDELENELQTWAQRVHPDDLDHAIEEIRKSQSDPEYIYHTIHRLRHKNGSWVWILDRGQSIFDSDGKAVRMVGFHTDITELKELQEQLIESAKELQEKSEMMVLQSRHAQMGEMISMIAHQWRQPLGVISMSVNNLLVDVELGTIRSEELTKALGEIGKQTSHLSKTIDDFRDFFKPDKVQSLISMEEILGSTCDVMSRSLQDGDIVMRKSFEKVAKVKVFERELQQVFINIFKNAKEAMDSKGVKEKFINSRIYETTDMVVVEICDMGGGIEEGNLRHVFDPYFSTKDTKNGTGLGLYMSKIIVEKHHGGVLSVKNIEGGSCFSVSLPKGEA